MQSRLYKKPYKPAYMISLAREQRNNPTPAEQRLWHALREKKHFGCRFRRQAPFGRFIFDFYCARKRVAIEIDGSVHDDTKEFDKIRDDTAIASGIIVLRFSNEEVMENIKEVLQLIESTLFPDTSFPPL